MEVRHVLFEQTTQREKLC